MSADDSKLQKSQPTIADLAMLVSRLVQQVRKYDPTNDVAEKAMNYLRRKDLTGSILRESTKRFAIKQEPQL